jgi:hypothetical protein
MDDAAAIADMAARFDRLVRRWEAVRCAAGVPERGTVIASAGQEMER